MKKIIVFLSIITFISVLSDVTKEKIVIPKESIRFRVIANSNSKEDQLLKVNIKNNLEKDINDIVKVNNIKNTREQLLKSIPLFKNNIDNTIKNNKSNMTYTINYGKNYFPSKKYKGVIYPAGKYESLVVKIGKGEGNNFWCVLFPPLCLIEENKTTKDIEYHILIKDILNKYL